jgi:hypothetical protein
MRGFVGWGMVGLMGILLATGGIRSLAFARDECPYTKSSGDRGWGDWEDCNGNDHCVSYHYPDNCVPSEDPTVCVDGEPMYPSYQWNYCTYDSGGHLYCDGELGGGFGGAYATKDTQSCP